MDANHLNVSGVAHSIRVPKGDVVLDVNIEGIRFQAMADSDPYVVQLQSGEWCQFGVARIREAPDQHRPDFKKWLVCKNETERRIDLSRLSQGGRQLFSKLFGIPLGEPGTNDFYWSSAFKGLVNWALRHPQLYAALDESSGHLPSWKLVVDQILTTVPNGVKAVEVADAEIETALQAVFGP